jgi:methylisocitrate lyase
MIFAEALATLDEYKQFTKVVKVPVLANITEFGKTPMFTTKELGDAGVGLVLYPLSAFRAMSKAAERVYSELRSQGTQKGVLDTMQTRVELYDVLGYMDYEMKLDELFKQDAKKK